MTVKTYHRTLGFLAGALALSAVAAAQVPVGTGFTYQGRLTDAGVPANGTYDFEFRLRTLPVSGLPFGPVTVNDVNVQDGLFTVQLDFAATNFTGQGRWLEVSVRPGNSGGAYTTLSPLQELTPVPYALYALGGGNWKSSGTAITNSNDGFVGVNRDTPIGASECFGIQAEVDSGYGGMYVRTDGEDAKPYYGYKCGATGDSAWTYLDGVTGKWHVHNGGSRLVITDYGDVGIGTTNPYARLHVADDGSGDAAQFHKPVGSTGNSLYAVTYGAGLAAAFESHQSNATPTVSISKNGRPVLLLSSNFSTPGTPAVDAPLAVVGGSDTGLTGGGFIVLGGVDTHNLSIDTNEIAARNNGAPATFAINNDGGDVNIAMRGTARCRVLEITGADLAEKFPVSAEVEPGMVVMIDADNAGKLCPALGAYNPRVAGVVSGANGLPAGTILGHLPGNEDAPPIALSGRVWTLCDATERSIEIGDSLTTADRPGHAMAATDRSRASGATIGKAMTALPQGQRGLVLVLVNLQ